ncbi:hypothetical protein GCM10029992_30050 [Glycomyces albus]
MTNTALDPAAPLVVDTAELGRGAGVSRELSREVDAPEALGIEVFKVPASAPLSLDLRLTTVSEGVLVDGEVEAPVEGSVRGASHRSRTLSGSRCRSCTLMKAPSPKRPLTPTRF